MHKKWRLQLRIRPRKPRTLGNNYWRHSYSPIFDDFNVNREMFDTIEEAQKAADVKNVLLRLKGK
jgi:hypothetical protein